MKRFQLAPGFRIELVAAEPEVASPVALAFDERGRMFVVEMPEYPISKEPIGRIRLLEDVDGDGKFEKSTVFADHLHFAHGVLPWKGGIIVTSAPDILYFADTNGDNRADVRKVLLTGFAQVNPQLRVNTPLYGMDNWIYAAYPKFGGGVRFKEFSNFGEPIHFAGHPEIPAQDIFSKGMDIRFKPDQLQLEPVSGNSEFGLTFDARGHRFTSFNNRHIEHVVLENRYLIRNPYLSVESAVQSPSDHGDAAQVYPITENSSMRELRDPSEWAEIGHFTSACGQSVYTGGNFPGAYNSAYFICEPASNLVHCDRVAPHGATFAATRMREKAEFLASKDSWFMPVFTTVGPDGALYVVDFYRKVIEHPEWIRKDLVNDLKLFNLGKDHGRIYRIVREGSPKQPKPRLNEASSPELVGHLSNPNMWWRLTAQRLLVERQDKSVIAALEILARNGAAAEGRMHALWTLEGLNALDPGLVLAALNDASPAVREQAVRLAEHHLSDVKIAWKLSQMTADEDDQVQFQVACTLGQLPPAKSFEPLRKIAMSHVQDSWFQVAVLTAAAENADRWFRSTVEDRNFVKDPGEGKDQFLKRIAGVLGARQKNSEIQEILAVIGRSAPREGEWWQVAGLQGLADGMKRGSQGRMEFSAAIQQSLLKLVETPSPAISSAALELATSGQLADSPQLRLLVRKASKVVRDSQSTAAERAHAASILGLDPTQSALPLLAEIFTAQQPEEVQLAVARSLLAMPEGKATQLVLDNWAMYTPRLREIVLAELLRHPDRVVMLLDATESGKVQLTSLSRSTMGKLYRVGMRDPRVAKRLHTLFAKVSNDRGAVMQKYQDAAKISGNAQRGMEVFRKNCSECHQIGNIGIKLGPDLATVTNQSKEELLTNILDPNANIAAGYEEYMIRTADGQLITGVMANQSATAVTLRRRKGEQDTVLRSNIAELRALTVSAMPENLEESIDLQQMSDLLAFLKSLGTVKTASADPNVHAN
jgi:putative membrane-bound dehydrogenase-like protein